VATTMASNERQPWIYTTDQNESYIISAKSAYVTGVNAAVYGGATGVGSDFRGIPNGFRPRRAQVANTTLKVSRWVICYESDATLYTTPETSVTLNHNGVDAEFVSTGATRGERAERKALFA
jgi:hypothetical protein